MKKQRIWVFIDGSNFYHCLIHQVGHAQFGNYTKFFERLLWDHEELAGITYYIGKINPTTGVTAEALKISKRLFEEQTKFLRWLQACGVSYKLGYFQKDGFSEKGVDVKIAVDMIKLAYQDRYDKAFLVSGDGDLVDAVNFVQELGKPICNLIFYKGAMFSYRLRRACNRYFYIDRQVEKFVKNNRRK